MSFSDNVIAFNRALTYTGKKLPKGIRVMNPYKEDPQALKISEDFYRKYYSDDRIRLLILGINPGRFGGGLTGVPFTDPKRLVSECHIPYGGKITHEPSSVFVYEMIHAYGGAQAFYRDFYINSICPLGFTQIQDNGKEKNYNYYDSPELLKAVEGFNLENIRHQIGLGVRTDICFCFGTGKNESYLRNLNEKHHFFGNIVGLEHPRFIMQYKATQKQSYINKYLDAFAVALAPGPEASSRQP
jgi:hypothetical protein